MKSGRPWKVALCVFIELPLGPRDSGQNRRLEFGMDAPQIVANEWDVGLPLPQCARRLANRTVARRSYGGLVVKAGPAANNQRDRESSQFRSIPLKGTQARLPERSYSRAIYDIRDRRDHSRHSLEQAMKDNATSCGTGMNFSPKTLPSTKSSAERSASIAPGSRRQRCAGSQVRGRQHLPKPALNSRIPTWFETRPDLLHCRDWSTQELQR
jgi:hypothetical protein